MKKTPWLLTTLLPLALLGQQQQEKASQTPKQHHSIGIGIKAGLNFANVTNASSINGSSRTGFHAGIFLAPETHSVLGSRTELLFSRNGYNYKSGTADGSVNLDYILLAQLMAIHITKYFEIDLGAQTGYLLHAKADSSQPSTGNASVDKLLSFYNRFDFGFGGGAEVHPIAGLIIGARYNISLTNLYKQSYQGNGTTPPSFIPSTSNINFKNNVVQLYLGYRF
jgi:hypothetical protein